MSIQFSVKSIEYLTEKLNNVRYLSDESLTYFTLEISRVIYSLLQDACKFAMKCRRKEMTTDDFAFALKLNHLPPLYGNYTSSNTNRSLFRKVKKDNRTLYQIDDNILAFNDLMNASIKVPFDISIRTHWLAINGEQSTINENPIIEKSIQATVHLGSQKLSSKISHILSTEQEIYYKELTEMCICSDGNKRKQALLMLSSDSSVQLIISRLILFISEGVRINLRPTPTVDRSNTLKLLIQMCDALLANETVLLELHLHYLLPAILSCLLEQKASPDHWSLRDLSAKCCGRIIKKYTTAINRLQQRIINVLYPILINNEEKYTWLTIYGAFVGLCEMSPKVIIQIVFPLVKQLGEKVRLISDVELSQKLTEVVVKFITLAYQSVHRESESNEKNLDEEFGSYFAPLIQHQLVLLL